MPERSHSLLLDKTHDDIICSDLGIESDICACAYQPLNKGNKEIQKYLTLVANLAVAHLNEYKDRNNASDYCLDVNFYRLDQPKQSFLSETKTKVKFLMNLKQDKDVYYEVIGIVDTSYLISSYEESTLNFKFESHDDPVSLSSVKMLSKPRELCEEISKAAEISSEMCSCNIPNNYSRRVHSLQMTQMFDNLRSKLNVIISEPGVSCAHTCAESSLNCKIWGLQLLNSLDMLNEP